MHILHIKYRYLFPTWSEKTQKDELFIERGSFVLKMSDI